MVTNYPENSIPLFTLKPKAIVDIKLAEPRDFKQGPEEDNTHRGLNKWLEYTGLWEWSGCVCPGTGGSCL